MCLCGAGHRGWEDNLCRAEIAKRSALVKTGGTTPLPAPIKSILGHSEEPKKTVTVTKQAKASVTVTNRMAALRKRKAVEGMLQVTVWTHPDDIAAIKEHAKELAAKR